MLVMATHGLPCRESRVVGSTTVGFWRLCPVEGARCVRRMQDNIVIRCPGSTTGELKHLDSTAATMAPTSIVVEQDIVFRQYGAVSRGLLLAVIQSISVVVHRVPV